MADPAPQDQVVEMVEYLRDTIAQIDDALHDLKVRRTGLAIRLAAIEASGDPAVAEAAAEYAVRVAENRPYEDAEAAESLLAEAYSRYAT